MSQSEKSLVRFMAFKVTVLAVIAAIPFMMILGCGPSAAEIKRQEEKEAREKLRADTQRALSQVRTVAEKLDGNLADDGLFKQDAPISETDPWGHEIAVVYRKNNDISTTLIVRSAGPDGLPNNADDIAVQKTRFRKDATKQQIEETTRGLTRGAFGGMVEGLTGKTRPPQEQKK